MVRKYTLNEEYFDRIDSFDKAYFFGFLMADGYNNEKRGVIELSCAPKDKEILGRLNKLIGSSKPLRFSDNKGIQSYRISWCSRRLSEKLASFGCVQNKSLKLKFPIILGQKLIKSFILGYFDGDGCISCNYSKRNNIFGNSFNSMATITSTIDFCLFLKLYFCNNLGVNSIILCRHPENNNSNRTLQISGNRQVIRFMEWLYDGAGIFLPRKYLKFLDIKKRHSVRASRLVELKKIKRDYRVFAANN